MQTRKDVSTVSEYIRGFPKSTQTRLQAIRKVVKDTEPRREETISYRMPTFKLNGKYLLYLGAFDTHIGLYPASDKMVKTIKGLGKYRVSKGTLRFDLDKPLPLTLIKQVVRYRVKERTAEALRKVSKIKNRSRS